MKEKIKTEGGLLNSVTIIILIHYPYVSKGLFISPFPLMTEYIIFIFTEVFLKSLIISSSLGQLISKKKYSKKGRKENKTLTKIFYQDSEIVELRKSSVTSAG